MTDGATETDQLAQFVATTCRVQSLPYAWPGPPDAESARRDGRGTCASKHALLAEELAALGLTSVPVVVVGPLVPAIWPDLLAEGAGLMEVHEYLAVGTPWSGPLQVDVTWPPAAVRAGLSGIGPDWDGRSDTPCAVGPVVASYAVPPGQLRTWKEALRARITTPAELELRARLLGEMARRASQLTD